MPKKAALDGDADERKKAKAAGVAHPLAVPGTRLVRKNAPPREANEIIGFDPTYQLRVANKVGGAHGIYILEATNGRKKVSFDVRRLSDFDTPMKDATGKLTGRRPSQKGFLKFEHITKNLKDDKKWEDTESPLLKYGDSTKEAFTYKRPEEVFPGQQVISILHILNITELKSSVPWFRGGFPTIHSFT
jgi:hypothetical protein